MSNSESHQDNRSVESSGPESAFSRGLRREVIQRRIPDGYPEDRIGRVESNLRFFQSNCSGLAFDDLLDLMNGDTGSLDGLYHDDDLLREGKIDLEVLQLLFGVMQYAGEPEDEAAKLAYIGYYHYCTEDEDDRKFSDWPESYRQNQLREAIERFDLGKWHRWRRRENADGFDEEDYRNWTDDYSDATYDILVALVKIGCGEVNPADAARLYEIDLPESSIVLENLYNGEYRGIPSFTKIGPVSNSTPYRDSRGYRYVPPKAVIEAAREVDGRSERTYKNALRRLRQRGVLKWAEIEAGEDYRYYPSMLPDPPDANRIKFEGEEYRPDDTSPSVDSKLMTDGGTCTSNARDDLERIRDARDGPVDSPEEPELYRCPVEGCSRTVIDDPTDLRSHVRNSGDPAHRHRTLTEGLDVEFDEESYHSQWGPGESGGREVASAAVVDW